MKELEQAIAEMRAVDREMAALFGKRLNAAREVARAQREMGIPAQEPVDPQSTIDENLPLVGDGELCSYYPLFLRNLMGLSAQAVHRVMDGIRVAYAGVPGAFAAIAAQKIYPDGCTVPYPDFRAAYQAVEEGECDCAVLPIENSYAGEVAQVMDLAYFGSLHINAVYEAQIHQCLLGTRDATVEGVREVTSHPQALSQCAEYIAAHGLLASEANNTALAARRVAEEGNPALAAIGSPEAAELYGLKILAANINESASNTTRFAVFTRVPHTAGAGENDSRFIMTFTVKNEAGALAKAISIIGECGFNMRALRSRPTKKLIWSNFFYLEGEGNLASDAGREMLRRLGELCSGLKVLGSYNREIPI